MKKKTKITLSVLTSLLIGGGIGTAIGYGVWGNHEEKHADTSVETSIETPSDSKSVEESAVQPSDSVKPAFRFGLRAPVMKAAPGISDVDAFVNSLSSYKSITPVAESEYNDEQSITIPDNCFATNGNAVIRFKNPNQASEKARFNVSLAVSDDDGNPDKEYIQDKVGLITGIQASVSQWFYNCNDNNSWNDALTNRNNRDYFYLIVNKSDATQILIGTHTFSNGEITVMKSSQWDYAALIDGQTKDIFVDVDKNYSKDTIISSISAKDLFGKDVPVTVTEGLDTFTPQTIGVYTLKLSATDSYGQTATATLIVHICDYVSPVVNQTKQLTFTADKGQSLNYSQLADYISVTDNGTSHGSSLTVTYSYDGSAMNTDWTKTFVSADYGTHNVKVTARDGSGNQTEKTFTLKVNDGTAPVIARRDGQAVGSTITIGLSKTFSTTLSDIIQMFKATDNVDGDVSASLAGVSDDDKNFFSNNHKVGSYTLHITAKDKDNNASTQDIPIVISADMPPVFLISDTLVYTDTATPLTTAALAKVVTNGILAKKNVASLSVDASEYIGNEDKPGTYNITYDYTEKEETKSARRFNAASDVKTGSFSLVVKEAADPGTKEETEGNWFTNLLKKIREFFEKLGNWFKGVFTKFKFDCFITNEEWKIRFGEEGKTETSDKLPAEKASE